MSVLDEKWEYAEHQAQQGWGEITAGNYYPFRGELVRGDIAEHLCALHNADLERRQNADAVKAGLQAKGLKS